jgi:hypothetical protein
VRYFDPDGRADASTTSDLYSFTFQEELCFGIMPIGGDTERRGFSVRLNPPDQNVEAQLSDALGGDRHSRELNRAVCDFVQQCARLLLNFDEAAYEIVYLLDGGPASRKVGFSLELVQPGTWTPTARGGIKQRIPREWAARYNVPQFVTIDAEHSIIFESRLFQRARMRRIRRALTRLSQRMVPEFVLQTDAMASSLQFDFKMYTRTLKQAIAQTTREIGWDARGLLADVELEFYQIYRRLRFEKFKIELRKEILEQLNEGLTKAGRALGFSTSIQVEGMPTVEEVNVAHSALVTGSSSFKEIIKQFAVW